MLWGSYKFVAIPLILVFFLLSCGTQVILPKELDTHQNVIVVSILTLLFPAAAFLAKVATVPSTLLPQEPPKGAMRLLWLPVVLESFKFCILFIASRMGSLAKVLHHALNVASLLLFFVVALTLYQNALHNMGLYQRFYSLLDIWEDCRLAPLPPSKIKHQGSIASLGSNGSGESEEAPSFNLNSFSGKSNRVLSQSKLMPILSTPLLSVLGAIDRFYSVSPKNTLHLASDDESLHNGPHGYNPYDSLFRSGLFSYEHSDVPSPLDGPDVSFEGSINSCDPMDPHCCNGAGSSLSINQLPPKDSTHSSSTSSSASSKSSRIGFLKWFHWLFPFNFFQKRKSKAFYRRLQRVQIKQRFSTFSLKNEASSLLSTEKPPLYGSLDLESQTFTPAYTRQYNCHDFYQFAKFSNANYDEWVSTTNQVDPIFRKFGVTIDQFSIFYFVAYVTELILAQFVSTMTLALPFYMSILVGQTLALYSGMFICHLFCTNFLKNQSERSYKFNILTALTVRILTFSGLVALYVSAS